MTTHSNPDEHPAPVPAAESPAPQPAEYADEALEAHPDDVDGNVAAGAGPRSGEGEPARQRGAARRGGSGRCHGSATAGGRG